MAIRPGTTMAANHVPQERCISELVALATNSTTSGLGAVGSNEDAAGNDVGVVVDQREVLTDFALSAFSGSESKLRAMERIIGCTIAPPRAVLLGVTGPMTKSAKAKL